MANRTPKNECGAPCEELNERQRAYHLLILMMGLPGGPRNLSECYTGAGYSDKGSPSAIRASATRLQANASVRAALAHHHDIDASRFGMTKDQALSWLAELVTAADISEPEARDGIAAVRQMAKMSGWESPKEISITDVREIAEDVEMDPDLVEEAFNSGD